MPISNAQCKLANIVERILRCTVVHNFRGFEWLGTPVGGKQELDIWVPHIKLAIEYDGEQHFYPVKFGNISDEQANRNFQNIRLLDDMKNKKISDNKDDVKYFVRFSYMDDICMEYVEKQLVSVGISIKYAFTYTFDDTLDYFMSPYIRDNWADYDGILY